MGNVVLDDEEHPESLDVEAGANVTDLSTKLDASQYLTPHSDIVALMVLEHQTGMHNLITLRQLRGQARPARRDHSQRCPRRTAGSSAR